MDVVDVTVDVLVVGLPVVKGVQEVVLLHVGLPVVEDAREVVLGNV
jgi:hypothetical protein